MTLPYTVLPSFATDANELPLDARKAALGLLTSIARRDVDGVALEYRASTGDLSDCFKVYFDPDPRNLKPRYRLVYRWVGGRVEGVVLQGVTVGARADLDAYARAAAALGRGPDTHR